MKGKETSARRCTLLGGRSTCSSLLLLVAGDAEDRQIGLRLQITAWLNRMKPCPFACILPSTARKQQHEAQNL